MYPSNCVFRDISDERKTNFREFPLCEVRVPQQPYRGRLMLVAQSALRLRSALALCACALRLPIGKSWRTLGGMIFSSVVCSF
jgi:hypothetical protein